MSVLTRQCGALFAAVAVCAARRDWREGIPKWHSDMRQHVPPEGQLLTPS